MNDIIQDPQHLLDRTRELEHARGIAEDALRVIRQRLQASTWAGHTAERNHAAVGDTSRLLSRTIDEISRAIDEVRHHARWTEEQRRQLADIEKRIRHWADLYHREGGLNIVPVGVAPEHYMPFPARFSTRWRDIEHSLRRQGWHG